jgi:hypothetical protein
VLGETNLRLFGVDDVLEGGIVVGVLEGEGELVLVQVHAPHVALFVFYLELMIKMRHLANLEHMKLVVGVVFVKTSSFIPICNQEFSESDFFM